MSFRPFAFAALLVVPFALHAQSFSTQACTSSDSEGGNHWFSSGSRVCEVRHATLPFVNERISVENQNGSIEVIGEDRRDISLDAKVTVQGPNEQEARATLREISIDTQGTIQAHGPKYVEGRGWSVSYHLRVPHQLTARLKTDNGSLSLTNLQGSIEASTTNGSVKFARLAGDVRTTTTNGSIGAELDGTGWQGKGLTSKTTNGGISVSASHNYSAHLIASTTNGSVNVSLPTNGGTTQRRGVDTQLGNGGATLIFQTTNGGISIR